MLNQTLKFGKFSFYAYHSHLSIVLAICGCVGIILSIWNIVFLIIYCNHKLIKATCSFISLLVAVSNAMINIPILLGAFCVPSDFVCTLFPLLPGINFGIIYSGIMVKIIRLVRVLRASEHNEKAKFMTSNNAVIIQTSLIIGFHV